MTASIWARRSLLIGRGLVNVCADVASGHTIEDRGQGRQGIRSIISQTPDGVEDPLSRAIGGGLRWRHHFPQRGT